MPSEFPPPLNNEFCTVTPTGCVLTDFEPWIVKRPS